MLSLPSTDSDVVCLQEVCPESFESDFLFLKDLGYDSCEMHKKGRFRPATFWKSSVLELAEKPAHKDRTLLTAFRRNDRIWYILNVHLQAGNQAQRRVRQINEGVKAVLTMARKLKEPNPEQEIALIVCGDFNGSHECGAIRYLEDGFVDETFLEDGKSVSSGKKELPLANPMVDVATVSGTREPPATMVVSELIPILLQGKEEEAFGNPVMSQNTVDRLTRIYQRLASDGKTMNVADVERWLVTINGKSGRGSEFREAAAQMGRKDPNNPDDPSRDSKDYFLPSGSVLTLESFLQVYNTELAAGKFWGVAYDLAALGEPLSVQELFHGRYDRMYCSAACWPVSVLEFVATEHCPNAVEPSDHLPVAAVFTAK